MTDTGSGCRKAASMSCPVTRLRWSVVRSGLTCRYKSLSLRLRAAFCTTFIPDAKAHHPHRPDDNQDSQDIYEHQIVSFLTPK